MKKCSLVFVLLFLSAFTYGSAAHAAPTIAHKKQLSVIGVPRNILQRVHAMSWLPLEGKGTPTLLPPVLFEEKDCEDITYRSWIVTRDEGEYGMSYRILFEARGLIRTKWMALPTEYTAPSLSEPLSLEEQGSLGQSLALGAAFEMFSCHKKDLIIKKTQHTREKGEFVKEQISLLPIRYSRFDDVKEWSQNANIKQLNQDRMMILNGVMATPKLVADGIEQIPGVLRVENGQIIGDSTPVTFDQKNAIHFHGLHHYRNLREVPTNENLRVLFYRMKDGYAVQETSYGNGQNHSKLYRIYNGDARYQEVNQLPLTAIDAETFQIPSGLGFVTGFYNNLLIHGFPSELYDVSSSILWETDAQAYIRYLITNKNTQAAQYWEATINKQ